MMNLYSKRLKFAFKLLPHQKRVKPQIENVSAFLTSQAQKWKVEFAESNFDWVYN